MKLLDKPNAKDKIVLGSGMNAHEHEVHDEIRRKLGTASSANRHGIVYRGKNEQNPDKFGANDHVVFNDGGHKVVAVRDVKISADEIEGLEYIGKKL